MADRERRGMLIKNSGTRSVRIAMATRTMELPPGEEKFITPEEVLDPALREALQIREISIVRPATTEEDVALREQLENQEDA
jgi:hypothetical protein